MLSSIQEKLLKMLGWFHCYCHENNLTYYIVGGSMLGAVRHGGFIPWDDDIDVVLPRPDYERLLSLFTEKNDHYILESPYTGNADYYYTYAKLYDTDTTLTEKTKRNCRRGIYIDVFPLDGVGKSEKEVNKNFLKVDRINMFLMTRTCAITRRRSFLKNVAIAFSSLIPSCVVNDHDLVLRVDKAAASFGYENSTYVANLMGAYRKREVMEKRIFGRPTEYKFENIVVNGVEHYDEFLTHIYGDWHKLPPEEKRKTAHEYVEIDLHKSWMSDTI